MASKERIGFIGLGNMGTPMARRLVQAGYELVVSDALPAAVERLAASSPSECAASLQSLGERCRVIITMLPDGSVVRQVLLGPGGVAPHLVPGSVIIDMSSSSPIGTRELAANLAKDGFALVDAPVSGGVRKAADGTLAIMVGGEPEPVARVQPILEVMGKVFLT